METEDQTEVLAFLGRGSTHGGAAVERIETHASVVFLAGPRAWKVKRAVRYDYLDFSTSARRKALCEAEVRVNRRTAPELYKGVVAVTREADGSLALGGTGVPVEWVIEMARFDQDSLFDRLAGRGALDLGLMPPLASEIARLHAKAERRGDHGGRRGMAWVVEGNAAGFAGPGAGILDPGVCDRVTRESYRALERHGALLDARRAAGFVRVCHGDLHLRNIVLLDGRPTLFDAIEFNDAIACIDVLYDLAFLLMDLWRRGLPRHANAVWNGYLGESGISDGLALMPLFLSCRASVRAKTSATAAALQRDAPRRGELVGLARTYLAMAGRLLDPPGPGLTAIGGYSGSGKSTLALALAPAVGPVPGAAVIRSDEIRKRLCGVDVLARLGSDGYAPDVTQRVYRTALERADTVVRAGHAAIVDAVFARPADRDAIEAVARAAGVPFAGLWLEAPEHLLVRRTGERGPDASDADAAVVRRQLREELGPIGWHRMDAAVGREALREAASALIERRFGTGALRAE